MRKEEVKVLALQDELKEAEKEWDKAINDVMAGKGIRQSRKRSP